MSTKTLIYFVRHAESIYKPDSERIRGLSAKGIADSELVAELLQDEDIDLFVSSPYQRAIETIQLLAQRLSKDILIEEDLRERRIGDFTSKGFKEAKRKVYEDFDFAYTNGESSRQAQGRAIKTLLRLLEQFPGERIVIGTHGDIMTLIMNYFNKNIGFDFWSSTTMPDIYRLEIEGTKLMNIKRLWK